MFTRLKQKDRFFEKGKLYAYSSGEIVACIDSVKNNSKTGNTQYILLSLGYCTLVMDECKNYWAWEFNLNDFFLSQKYHFLASIGSFQLNSNKRVVSSFPDDIVCRLTYHEVPEDLLGYFSTALKSETDVTFYKDTLMEPLKESDLLPGCIYILDAQAVLMLGRVTLVGEDKKRRTCYLSTTVRVTYDEMDNPQKMLWSLKVKLLQSLKKDLDEGTFTSVRVSDETPSKGYLGCTSETLTPSHSGGRFINIPSNFLKGSKYSVEV